WDAGFAVPRPVRTLDGDWIAAYRDAGGAERSCTLETWLAGRRYLEMTTPGQAAALGRLLGTLHEHARSFAVPAGFDLREADPAAELSDGLLRLLPAEGRRLVDTV